MSPVRSPARIRRAAPALDQRVAAAVVFAATMFISIMDVTIVNVALPSIARDFGASTGSIELVVIGYLVSLAVFIPASGWLGDRFGTKRVFLVALAAFTAASALCGAATSLDALVGFRMLQGVGGGILMPVGTAMLFRVFPPEQRVRAARVVIVPTVIAPAAGPVLGGILTDHLSWHWVFLVNLPVGLAVFVFGLVFLAEHREPGAAGRFDLVGFVLAAAGFALILYALSSGPGSGWASAKVGVAGSVGLAATVLMVIWERRRDRPLLALRLLGERLFRATNLTMLFATMAFLGTLYLIPLFLQDARGVNATTAGLALFPEALGVLAGSQLAGRGYPRIGPRRLMVFGLLLVAAMLASISRMDLATSIWLIRGMMFLVGTGMGFVFLSAQTAAFARISPVDTGQASTLFNMQRQLASALGVGLVTTALTLFAPAGAKTTAAAAGNAAAYHGAFLVAAALAVVAAGFALTVRDSDAANTMRPHTPDGLTAPRDDDLVDGGIPVAA